MMRRFGALSECNVNEYGQEEMNRDDCNDGRVEVAVTTGHAKYSCQVQTN